MRIAVFALGAGALAAAAPVRAEGALVIQDARLHDPPDSHEPQRALMDLRNTGPDPAVNVTVLCTFTGAGGAVLETRTTVVAAIPGQASARAEAIYYGWPRAGAVSCRLAKAR